MAEEDRTQVQARNINKKKQFVQNGVFRAEVNAFLQRTLAMEGYAGIDVIQTTTQTQINLRATRVDKVLGDNQYRIRELSSQIKKRFNYPKEGLELLAKRVINRGLCAAAQAESLRYKLLMGFPVRMAANGIVRFVMHSGAKGIEVAVSGKLRAQRAKTMKFRDGYMISSGEPKRVYIDEAVRDVHLKQGVLGVKVRIMLPYDPEGVIGPNKQLPDHVEIVEPKTVTRD